VSAEISVTRTVCRRQRNDRAPKALRRIGVRLVPL
jgi:hypothetical protein